MMTFKASLTLLFACILPACVSTPESKSPFVFSENSQGIELMERGEPVFFYQSTPTLLGGEIMCNNYIHPLYSIDGDTLTEVSPVDHLNHRGVFWAWHQIFIGDERVSYGWVMDNLSLEVTDAQTEVNKDSASLALTVLWKSPVYENSTPYLQEHTTITVHRLKSGVRSIDFEIVLKALVPNLSIGGSENEKGYGGFCTRIRMPDDLIFTSENGAVSPQLLQLQAGPWMDFTATFGKQGEESGIALLCHPSTPNYPAPWILRQKSSMQNIVFPGQKRVPLSISSPTVLRYRLLIHRGKVSNIDISSYQSDYEMVRMKDAN
jgi:hypothetical protein